MNLVTLDFIFFKALIIPDFKQLLHLNTKDIRRRCQQVRVRLCFGFVNLIQILAITLSIIFRDIMRSLLGEWEGGAYFW